MKRIGALLFFCGLFLVPASAQEGRSLPNLGCWFWSETEFEPGGYKSYLDLVKVHTPYQLLTTSLRVPIRELLDDDTHAQIQAAAGGLREFTAGDFHLVLPVPVDLALWRDADGRYHGVVQGHEGLLPEALQAITRDWIRLAWPKAVE